MAFVFRSRINPYSVPPTPGPCNTSFIKLSIIHKHRVTINNNCLLHLIRLRPERYGKKIRYQDQDHTISNRNYKMENKLCNTVGTFYAWKNLSTLQISNHIPNVFEKNQ